MKPINTFPGYEFVPCGDDGKPHNMYKGEDVGFGGYVYAEPGMYGRTVCFDVSGMHPASIRALNLFGEYTKNFGDIVDARLAIKHKDYETARKMLNGKLAPYLNDESTAKDLAKALKVAVNSTYGLTAANFDNPCRDIRNKNNIVALRGALFIVDLKHEIQNRGFKVIHCKTDSIKVVEPDEEISNFIIEYGKKYGYQFEIEHVFEKICLVDDAVYIAKLAFDDPDEPGQWTATGTQFAVPYVFKTLFSKEPIEFKDMCETFSVKSALYLDMNESLPDVTFEEKEREKLRKKLSNNPTDDELVLKIDELTAIIDTGHDYRFVGKVGQFCPVIPGKGGGILCREQNGKYYAATGTTGFRWMESELVEQSGSFDIIDESFYRKLVDNAVDAISEYGDFEMFTSNNEPELETPPWLMACGKETCQGCESFDRTNMSCKKNYDISDIAVLNNQNN